MIPPKGSIPPQFPKCSVFLPKTCKFPPGGPCDPRLRITALDPKSIKTNEDKEKANILANFFTSVFTIEPVGETPTLEDRVIFSHMDELNINEVLVAKLLRNLNVNKSPGLDGLHPRFLRETADVLAKPLYRIFNQSLEQQRVPDEWKKGRISAIYKKGNNTLAGNYRPVSLTSIVCKIMEKTIRAHIVHHMNINKLFTDKQYGFMSGRSTSLQLLAVLDKWTEALDSGSTIDCIYMDFRAAFDTVPHKRVISKLQAYGLSTQIIQWITSFLDSRVQRVDINGQTSDWTNVTSGIPQGSVLGPILFVMFINDLPDLIKSEVFLFTDDTKVFSVNKSACERCRTAPE